MLGRNVFKKDRLLCKIDKIFVNNVDKVWVVLVFMCIICRVSYSLFVYFFFYFFI